MLSHFVYIISQKVYLSKDPVFKAVPVFAKIVRIEGRGVLLGDFVGEREEESVRE